MKTVRPEFPARFSPRNADPCRDCPAAATCTRAGECPLARLVELLEREADLRICVIECDWDRVDAARDRASALGVADRVTVHHAAAIEFCRLAS